MHLSVQGQMGKLVVKCAAEIVEIGTKEDRLGVRNGDRRTPGRSASAGEGIESSSVGNDDEADGTEVDPAKTRPNGGASGFAC
jgi:hypothetical protein